MIASQYCALCHKMNESNKKLYIKAKNNKYNEHKKCRNSLTLFVLATVNTEGHFCVETTKNTQKWRRACARSPNSRRIRRRSVCRQLARSASTSIIRRESVLADNYGQCSAIACKYFSAKYNVTFQNNVLPYLNLITNDMFGAVF